MEAEEVPSLALGARVKEWRSHEVKTPSLTVGLLMERHRVLGTKSRRLVNAA